jgi:hypothetical protein
MEGLNKLKGSEKVLAIAALFACGWITGRAVADLAGKLL